MSGRGHGMCSGGCSSLGAWPVGAGRGVASVGLAGGCGQQGVTKCDVGVASMGVAKAV